MDRQASVSSQKTSPQRDPAAFTQLTSELSAQANQLAIHQHQLTRLTALTEELVRSLQGLSLSPPAPAAAQEDIPVNIPNHPPPPVSPCLAFPERFNGDSTMCKGFLLQCSLFVTQQPALYPNDASKIAFACSLLTGRALDWVTAIWRGDGSAFPSFDFFLQHFKEIFDHPAGGRDAGEQLLTLSQGRTTAAEYALAFRTLTAQTTWVEDTLKLLFRRGLNVELQAELACRDEGRKLSDFIELTIQIDNLMRSRRFPRSPSFNPSSPVSSSEPMQIGYTHLSSEERERRRVRHHLCMYCGQAGHLKSSCPVQPASATPRAVSPIFPYKTITSCIKVPVTLLIGQRTVSTEALIDSGAAGDFMSIEFAHEHHLSLTPCTSYLAVEALDGRPLGEGRISRVTDELSMQIGILHKEILKFYVISSPTHPLILGLPWLRKHDPYISWKEGEIKQWGSACHEQCIRHNIPVTVSTITLTQENSEVVHVPSQYADLLEAFSKVKATELPPHRSSDCSIELIPGSTPPKGRIFPLSQPEAEAMKKYIEEELTKGFIRPSTSPASAGFFFVKKKDGSLRQCIDYRGLNDITIKFRYPLPLVPAALEQPNISPSSIFAQHTI